MRRSASTGGVINFRPTPTSSRCQILAAAIIITVAGWLGYSRTFSVPFLLDDAAAIVSNPSIRNLWPLGSVLSPPAEISTGGRPFTNLSFALNYAFGGTSVTSYHIVNLLIHVAASLTLFGLVRRALRQLEVHPLETLSRRLLPQDDSLLLAFAVAALWRSTRC